MQDALNAHADTEAATYIAGRIRNWDGMDDTVTYRGHRGQEADHVAKMQLTTSIYDALHSAAANHSSWRRHPLYDDMSAVAVALCTLASMIV